MKLTKFYRSVDYDGSVKDDYYNNIYLRKYKLKLWFCQNDLSEDGTVELSSTIDIDHTFIPIVDPDPDRPVSEKDFSGKRTAFYVQHFTATGLESLRSGHSGNKQGGNVLQWAGTDSGEDGGVAIPAAIVIGVLGAGAAASGAAAGTDGGAGSGESAEDERKKKRYKMYIQKDFGDAIRKGADPVTVRARIAEVSEDGTERDRNDLTARINSVSGGGMEIHRAVLAGRYCEAVVSIPGDYEGETADITFTFEGEGGSFHNTVRFRAVGEPQIVFLTDDASRFSYNGQFISVDMIEGDGLTYPLRFTVKDALTEPDISDMYGRDNDGFFAKFEKTDELYTYIAQIANNTAKKSEGGFFLHSEEIITAIYVKCGGKEPACGSVRVTLVPEGLSIARREIKDGFMTVDTNRDESAAGLDPVIRPVGFETVLAYTVDEENGRRAYIVEPHDYEVSFGELCGEKEYIETFKTSLKYEIDTRMADDKKFAFRPKVVLPQPKDPFEIEIPISATHNGNYFAVKLPIKLYGEQPKVPTEWDKERELLQRALMRYGLGDNEHLRMMVRNARSLKANEMLMLRHAIIEEAMVYYTKEAKDFARLDQSLGRYEFTVSCMKWIIDQAFSIVATRIFGATGEAFLTPFKDLVGQFLGELTASAYWGGEIETSWDDVGQTALKGCENAIANMMGDAVSKGDVKRLCGVIASFLCITFVEKYYWDKETKGDVYKSTVATLNDLSTNAIKTAICESLGGMLKDDPGLQNSLKNYFAKDFCKRFPNGSVGNGHSIKFATDTATKWIVDVVGKYVSEFAGLCATIYIEGAQSVHGKMVDISYDSLSELEQLKADLQAGKISAQKAGAEGVGLTCRTMAAFVEKGNFDIDIKVGDSVLRINIIDNLKALAEFLLNFTFATALPAVMPKPIPITDCTVYFKE